MPKPLGLGLEKQVIELDFVDGMKNKLAVEVRPDGQLFDVVNADLSLVGKMQRRPGFDTVDPHSIGPETSSLLTGTYRKLFERDGELCCISDMSVSVGSGAGSRDTGDTVFSYAPDMIGWKPHAKVPRSTMEQFLNFATSENNGVSDCAVTSGGICMVAWYGKVATYGYEATFVRIIDLNTGATVLDTTAVGVASTLTADGPSKIQCIAIGSKLFVIYSESSTNIPKARYYDTSVRTGAFFPALGGGGTALTTAGEDWDVATDGTSLYIAVAQAPNIFSVWDAGLLGPAVTHNMSNTGTLPTNIAIDVAFGLVSVAYSVSTSGAVGFEQFTTAGVRTGTLVNMGFAAGLHAQVGVLALSSSRCAVFANQISLAAPSPSTSLMSMVEWRPVSIAAGTSTPTSGVARVGNVLMYGHPFLQGGHVCVPFFGYDAQMLLSEHGYVVAEIDMSDSALFSTEVPLPIAAYGVDFASPKYITGSLFKAFPRGGINGSNWYSLGRFLIEPLPRAEPAAALTAPSIFRLIALNFSDTARWQAAPFKKMTVLGSSLPSCYDGRVAHECGHIFRPKPLSVTGVASGSLTDTKEYFFQFVYTWADSFGQRWFSAPSYASRIGEASSFVAATPNLAFNVEVRPPVLSAKTANSNYEQQDLQVWLFMTDDDNPNEYFLAQKKSLVPGFNGPVVFNVIARVGLENEQIYTSGGELENTAPPPATSIEAHRDRLFAISGDSLWYTKPAALGRGIEWVIAQQVPLANTGMGVVSNEAALVVFTQSDTYALEGYGPSPTGEPADAFGRLIQVSSQIGLVERNAARNTPVGIIFRSAQGWYLLKNTMELTYIGADIETIMSDSDTVTAMAVDQKKACVRIVMTGQGGTSYQLNYWYDTNRWSRDTMMGTSGVTFVLDNLVIGDNYYALLGQDAVQRSTLASVDAAASHKAYQLRVETGWFTLKNFQQTKRIWRVYATVKNNTLDASMGLTMTVYGDWNDSVPVATRTFAAANLTAGIQTLRVHLPIQKLKAIRVVLEETISDPAAPSSPGIDFLGLGFEVGLKRGGPKVPAAATQ